jgi:phosphonate transport system substrate-binding protein
MISMARRLGLSLLLLLVALPQFALAQANPVQATRAQTLVLATLSTRPDYHLPRLAPIGEAIAADLRAFGITKLQVRLAKDVPALCALFRSGDVDWAGVTIAAAAKLARDCNAELSVRALDQRGSVYKTQFFARSSTAYKTLADLRGHTLALRSKGSTSSFYVPLMMLKRENIPFVMQASLHQAKSAEAVNIVLAGSETNTALWVKLGLADAGVANSNDWLEESLFPAQVRAELSVFLSSEAIPLGIELLRADLSAPLKQALTNQLLALHLKTGGSELIQRYSNSDRFERLPTTLLTQLEQYSALFAAFD